MAETTAPLLDVRGVTIQYKTTEHRITATYRVDFQVPSDATAGAATLQLIAAWIPGPTVTIPVGAR